MIEVVIEEMVGSDWVPDRNDCERAFGWKAKPSTRAKWRSFPSAGRCVLKQCLTPPTLLEMAILQQQSRRCWPSRCRSGFSQYLERCRSGHPHPETSQGRADTSLAMIFVAVMDFGHEPFTPYQETLWRTIRQSASCVRRPPHTRGRSPPACCTIRGCPGTTRSSSSPSAPLDSQDTGHQPIRRTSFRLSSRRQARSHPGPHRRSALSASWTGKWRLILPSLIALDPAEHAMGLLKVAAELILH